MSKKKPANVDSLLSEGLCIIQEEIAKIKKNQHDQLLDTKAAQTLNEYLRTLLAMKREERQSNMEEDIDKLSDAKLTELAKEAATYLANPTSSNHLKKVVKND